MPLPFKVSDIPEALRKSLPKGLGIVRRGDRDLLVVKQIQCRRGCELVTPVVKIHGENAICFRIKADSIQGLLFIDAFWGGHKKLFDFMFSDPESDPILEAFCPHCRVPLTVDQRCHAPDCRSARKIELYLPDRTNRLLACARWGCPGHELIVNDVPREILEDVSGTNFFGEGEQVLFDERD